jgi:hypothetical protein
LDPNGPKLEKSPEGQISNRLICGQIIGGRDRDRTGDPLLAKQVLSQLSYTPTARYCTSFSNIYAEICNDSLVDSFAAFGATVFGIVNP